MEWILKNATFILSTKWLGHFKVHIIWSRTKFCNFTSQPQTPICNAQLSDHMCEFDANNAEKVLCTYLLFLVFKV